MKLLNGNITQVNTGTLQGKLFNTFNCDLDYDKGKISISPRTILTTDTLANMGVPIGFKYFDTRWFTCAERMYVNDGTPQGVFAQDTSSGAPTTTLSSNYSDLEVFGSVLLVSTTDTLYSKVSNSGLGTGSYTVRRTFGGGTSPSHPICVYNARAYWQDTRGQIFSMDTAYTSAVTTATSYTFLVPDGHDVVFMRKHATGIYIATLDPNGGGAYIYDWNGVTADTYRNRFQVSAQGILAGCVDDKNILYIMTSDAELLEFTGSGFKPAGRLPIKRNILYKATSIILNNRFIHPNGMCKIDGDICLLINNRENSTTSVSYQPNIHSGIWAYNGESLYHKYSLSYKTYSGAITDYGQTTLNLVGGLANCAGIFATADSAKGNFLAGASYFTTSSVSTGLGYGIWSDDSYDAFKKAGFFSTQMIQAQHFVEMWEKLTVLYTPTSGFNFVVKYRVAKQVFSDFDITWVSQKTFTTTQTGLSKGDEIFIFQGKGSGRVSHILSVTGSGTYTVTLTDTIETVSGTARARKENWKYIGTISNTSRHFDSKPISQPDTLIEIKVVMVGTGEVTINELVLDNNLNQ